MRSRQLGQNFLRNKRTARRLVHLAGGEPQLLCVDLGAGTGSVTEAALAIRTGSILAVEYDQRLVAQLKARYADEPRVMVRSADLLAAPLPDEPFIIAANPPFNTSTKLVRRWMLAPTFVSGALIVEAPFAGRVSGSYGATKLSLSLAPFLQLEIGVAVKSAEFTPAPNVATVILTSSQRPTLDVARGDAPA
ncbi:MAG: rRNA adenine N-6-methyltransferase family protein [Candidatus Microthrix parvicella]